eukprot:366490-Chlamydomonas_euryale.AAC.4
MLVLCSGARGTDIGHGVLPRDPSAKAQAEECTQGDQGVSGTDCGSGRIPRGSRPVGGPRR